MATNLNDIDIIEYLTGSHPVNSYASYTEMKADLEAGVANGTINKQYDETSSLVLYDYNSYAIFDNGWTRASLLSRGLVIDEDAGKVVAYCFPKFFNYGEATLDLPSEKFQAYEKLDGSLGLVYYHDGRWRVNTRGSFKSDQAMWAQEWLYSNTELLAELDAYQGYTFLCEIIYPENRIVINYDFDGLVLLGGYDTSGTELEIYDLDLSMRKAHKYTFSSVEEMLEHAKEIEADQEGWVVRYEGGYRVKIKGDHYCRIHRIISHCTPLSMWNSLMELDDLTDVRKELPEEFRIDMDNMTEIIMEMYSTKLEVVRKVVSSYTEFTPKEIGLMDLGEDAWARPYIFAAKKVGVTEFLESLERTGNAREKFFQSFRPTGNELAGFIPTSAMNRFT